MDRFAPPTHRPRTKPARDARAGALDPLSVAERAIAPHPAHEVSRIPIGPVLQRQARPAAIAPNDALFLAMPTARRAPPHVAPPHMAPSNRTGLPDQLKNGIETLSGVSMDGVRVHRNSAKPAQLHALAYAKGGEIHLAPGQDHHLPHEAWHVVQQAKGRVQPTQYSREGVAIHDSPSLEQDAEIMGQRALSVDRDADGQTSLRPLSGSGSIVQRVVPGFEDVTVANLDPDWIYSYINDVTDQEAHLYEADIERFVGADAMNGAKLVFDKNHFNLEIENAYGDIFVQTRADGNCAAYAAYALLHKAEFTDNAENFTSPPLFVENFRRFVRASLLVDEQEAKRRIVQQLQGSDNIAETGFGQRLMQLLASRAQAAQRLISRRRAENHKRSRSDFEGEQSTTARFKHVDQRIKIETTKDDILYQIMAPKGNQKYVDPTYHDTTRYIDEEFGEFWDRAEEADKTLSPAEILEAYDLYLEDQKSTLTPIAKKSKLGSIEVTGSSPYTTMTPDLLDLYQNAHYTEKLQKQDATKSTREYEFEYLRRISTKLPFSVFRAFALPETPGGETGTMLNEIGASLDVQTPTSSNTIGQGKVYSMVFKHFQRSMEMLNQQLDQTSPLDLTDDGFKKRTEEHLTQFDWLQGMLDNEAKQDNPFGSWEKLNKVILELKAYLDDCMQSLLQKGAVFRFPDLPGTESQVLKQIQLLGTMVGLMYKDEKRKILSLQLLDPNRDVGPHLDRLYRLHQVESKLNEEAEERGLFKETGKTARKKPNPTP